MGKAPQAQHEGSVDFPQCADIILVQQGGLLKPLGHLHRVHFQVLQGEDVGSTLEDLFHVEAGTRGLCKAPH